MSVLGMLSNDNHLKAELSIIMTLSSIHIIKSVNIDNITDCN
jgi:hypothetical protein